MDNGFEIDVIPDDCSIDMRPNDTSDPFRIFISIPKKSPPPRGWPFLVLTDGNATFPFAQACLVTQAPHTNETNIDWGVIVAIGYPVDDPYDPFRRSWDLSPPPGKTYPPFYPGAEPVRTGGADMLLDFIAEKLLPKIAEMTRIDPERGTLFGHSFGGLFTLFALFRQPDLFKNWVSASPSIYWEEEEILEVERSRRPARASKPFLHLSAGEYEAVTLAPFERLGTDAAERLKARQIEKTVVLAQDMAKRLNGAADGLEARFELFADETHMSVLAPAINRSIKIAFSKG
ncbi:alpha/beta hydrolase [Agrobacterium sp. ES01]|uniref:alpha/beta hydrolase n=1 Tax=Agrobacterium sp. ES01 TaxID=3420714 RepID=UPI003D10FEEF